MERRYLNAEVAEAVMVTMNAAGITTAMLSKATDIEESDLDAMLANKRDMTYGQLSDVSGFFGLPITHFTKGAAA